MSSGFLSLPPGLGAAVACIAFIALVSLVVWACERLVWSVFQPSFGSGAGSAMAINNFINGTVPGARVAFDVGALLDDHLCIVWRKAKPHRGWDKHRLPFYVIKDENDRDVVYDHASMLRIWPGAFVDAKGKTLNRPNPVLFESVPLARDVAKPVYLHDPLSSAGGIYCQITLHRAKFGAGALVSLLSPDAVYARAYRDLDAPPAQ